MRTRRRWAMPEPNATRVADSNVLGDVQLVQLEHKKDGTAFHHGRFATLIDVVNHYHTHFDLGLNSAQKSDLVEYLKGI
jgi:hypothetical protein